MNTSAMLVSDKHHQTVGDDLICVVKGSGHFFHPWISEDGNLSNKTDVAAQSFPNQFAFAAV